MILLVATNRNLSCLWARHLQRQGQQVAIAASQAEAVEILHDFDVQVVVIDLMLEKGSAIAVADFASYRLPEARVIFVTRDRFFSDGSLFNHIPNMAAVLPEATPPHDMAAIVAYHGEDRRLLS